MKMSNQPYTPGQKRWLVEQHTIRGKSLDEVAREHGLARQLIVGWKGVYMQGFYSGFPAIPPAAPAAHPVSTASQAPNESCVGVITGTGEQAVGKVELRMPKGTAIIPANASSGLIRRIVDVLG